MKPRFHLPKGGIIVEKINIITHIVINKSDPTIILMYDDQRNIYEMTYKDGIMAVRCNNVRLTGDCFGDLYGHTCELKDFLWMAHENGYDFIVK